MKEPMFNREGYVRGTYVTTAAYQKPDVERCLNELALRGLKGFNHHEWDRGFVLQRRKWIFTLFYFVASGHSREVMRDMFPETKGEVPQISKFSFLSEEDEPASNFFWVNRNKSHAHSGRSCARKFDNGDAIYTCEQCGIDATTVLCSKCFNKEDHKGHNTSVRFATFSNEGICDCGDETSWLNELHCKAELEGAGGAGGDGSGFKHDIGQSSLVAVTLAIDMVIEFFRNFDHSLRFRKNYGDVPLNTAGYEHLFKSSEVGLIIWNDEHHSITDAFRAIRLVTYESNEVTNDWVRYIDRVGFRLLTTGTRSSMEDKAKQLENIGFRATVISVRDYLQLLFMFDILKWLKQACEETIPEVQSAIRAAIKEACLSVGHYDTPVMSTVSEDDIERIPAPALGVGLLDDHGRIPTGTFDVQNTRVQLLYFLEPRYPKKYRAVVHSTFAPVLISSLDTRIELGRQLTFVYPTLIECMAHSDREFVHSGISDVFFQLYACPETSKALYAVPDLPAEIIRSANLVLRAYLKATLERNVPPHIILQLLRATICAFNSIANLFICPQFHVSQVAFFQPSATREIVELLSMLDEMNQFLRKTGDHVVRDDKVVHGFIEVYTTLTRIIWHYGETTTHLADMGRTDEAMEFIQYIGEYLIGGPSIDTRAVLFHVPVSESPQALTTPLNDLFIRLVQSIPHFDFSAIRFTTKSPAVGNTFELLQEESLRVIVFHAQVEAGFWARNGRLLRYQAELMRVLSDRPEVRMCQAMVLAGADPVEDIDRILVRFGLADWLLDQEWKGPGEYDDKLNNMLGYMLEFLYLFATNWEWLKTTNNSTQFMREKIVSALAAKPMAYSDIQALLLTFPKEPSHDGLDSVLEELCTYRKPTGVHDVGMYELKPSVLETVDPMALCYSAGSIDVVELDVRKSLARARKCKEHEVIIKPQPTTLPESRKTEAALISKLVVSPRMLQLVARTLKYSVAEETDSVLSHTLHLLHRIMDDHEFGVSGINSAEIPDIVRGLCQVFHASWSSPAWQHQSKFLLRQIFQLMGDMGPITEFLGQELGAEAAVEFLNTINTESKPVKDASKDAAKNRRKKLLKKMKKQQAQFESNNQDEDMEIGVDEEKDLCISCHTGSTKTKPLGLPLECDLIYPYRTWQPCHGEDLIYTEMWNTCGHLIHKECFRDSSPFCPFCGFIGAEVLPYTPVAKPGLPEDFMSRAHFINDLEKVFFPEGSPSSTARSPEHTIEQIVSTIERICSASGLRSFCGENAFSEKQLKLIHCGIQSLITNRTFELEDDYSTPIEALATTGFIPEYHFSDFAVGLVRDYRSLIGTEHFVHVCEEKFLPEYKPLTEEQEALIKAHVRPGLDPVKVFWDFAYVTLNSYKRAVMYMMALFPGFELDPARATSGDLFDKINYVCEVTGLDSMEKLLMKVDLGSADYDSWVENGANVERAILSPLSLKPPSKNLKDYKEDPLLKRHVLQCLLCSEYVSPAKYIHDSFSTCHKCMQEGPGFFFDPEHNSIVVVKNSKIWRSTYRAPFVTRHGEPSPGVLHATEEAFLDETKWKYINDQFLSMNLHQYQMKRDFTESRLRLLSRARTTASDEDSDGEGFPGAEAFIGLVGNLGEDFEFSDEEVAEGDEGDDELYEPPRELATAALIDAIQNDPAVRQETMEAVQEFQRTGNHERLDQVMVLHVVPAVTPPQEPTWDDFEIQHFLEIERPRILNDPEFLEVQRDWQREREDIESEEPGDHFSDQEDSYDADYLTPDEDNGTFLEMSEPDFSDGSGSESESRQNENARGLLWRLQAMIGGSTGDQESANTTGRSTEAPSAPTAAPRNHRDARAREARERQIRQRQQANQRQARPESRSSSTASSTTSSVGNRVAQGDELARLQQRMVRGLEMLEDPTSSRVETAPAAPAEAPPDQPVELSQERVFRMARSLMRRSGHFDIVVDSDDDSSDREYTRDEMLAFSESPYLQRYLENPNSF